MNRTALHWQITGSNIKGGTIAALLRRITLLKLRMKLPRGLLLVKFAFRIFANKFAVLILLVLVDIIVLLVLMMLIQFLILVPLQLGRLLQFFKLTRLAVPRIVPPARRLGSKFCGLPALAIFQIRKDVSWLLTAKTPRLFLPKFNTIPSFPSHLCYPARDRII
jgi:hypothetical protein